MDSDSKRVANGGGRLWRTRGRRWWLAAADRGRWRAVDGSQQWTVELLTDRVDGSGRQWRQGQ